jgi:hypothetical protein
MTSRATSKMRVDAEWEREQVIIAIKLEYGVKK